MKILYEDSAIAVCVKPAGVQSQLSANGKDMINLLNAHFAENGETALAAVGSTGSLTALITGLFIGLAVGANVSLSHAFGSGREESVRDIVHTSVSISFILGAIISVFGFIAAPFLLSLMGVPSEVLSYSVLYMRIIFIGMPAQMAYNYGAAVLNARGDTKHPFYFLLVSGALNVCLNFIFVVFVGMDVDGVGAGKHAHACTVDAAGIRVLDAAGAHHEGVVNAVLDEDFRKVAAGADCFLQHLTGDILIKHVSSSFWKARCFVNHYTPF